LKNWLSLLLPGDWLMILLTGALVGLSFPFFWQGGTAERAIVRQAGAIFAEVDLRHPRHIEVSGPLGTTFITIETGRARIAADPSPRQYCVRQGWLMRPGDIAICAPNQVSLQVVGRTRRYDSLSY
jgi:hypothetical protein